MIPNDAHFPLWKDDFLSIVSRIEGLILSSRTLERKTRNHWDN